MSTARVLAGSMIASTQAARPRSGCRSRDRTAPELLGHRRELGVVDLFALAFERADVDVEHRPGRLLGPHHRVRGPGPGEEETGGRTPCRRGRNGPRRRSGRRSA